MEESKSRVEVKSGSELGGGFKQMSAEEVKIEKIDITPTTTYVSPEVKKRQQFKYYNNTYTYITFRPSFLKTEEGGKKPNLKTLWNDDIVKWLKEMKADEEKKLLDKTDVDKIKL